MTNHTVLVNNEPELGLGEICERLYTMDGDPYFCVRFNNNDIGYYTADTLSFLAPSTFSAELQLQLVQ